MAAPALRLGDDRHVVARWASRLSSNGCAMRPENLCCLYAQFYYTVSAQSEGDPRMSEQATLIEGNLTDLRTALAADGYRLSVTDVSPDALRLEIEALSDACPDCLVSPSVMETIVRASIPDDERFTTLEITYPAGVMIHD